MYMYLTDIHAFFSTSFLYFAFDLIGDIDNYKAYIN